MQKMKTMTEGAPWKHVLKFSLPVLAGSTMQQLYNTVDAIVVGNYSGEDALAAVGIDGHMSELSRLCKTVVPHVSNASLWLRRIPERNHHVPAAQLLQGHCCVTVYQRHIRCQVAHLRFSRILAARSCKQDKQCDCCKRNNAFDH